MNLNSECKVLFKKNGKRNERRYNGMSKKDPFKINLQFLLIAIVC